MAILLSLYAASVSAGRPDAGLDDGTALIDRLAASGREAATRSLQSVQVMSYS